MMTSILRSCGNLGRRAIQYLKQWTKPVSATLVTGALSDLTRSRADLIAEYRKQFASPYFAAARGYLDSVIAPRETRPRLISALKMLQGKRASLPMKKHSNIPL
mgnify:CR=1 FL=1